MLNDDMPSQELNIRKFKESDYPEIVRLENKVFPEAETSEESLRFRDKNRSEKCEHQRFVAELDGEIIGHGLYSQWERSYQEGKFYIYEVIHQDHQGKGFGKRFYHYLLKELQGYDPRKLECKTKEGKERAIKFIEDRDFEETIKRWPLELNVEDFDFEEYNKLKEKLEEEEIELTSLGEIGIDEKICRKVYELYEEVWEDVPMPDEHTGMEFNRWMEFFDSPDFFPEGYILAVKDDEFIGLSTNWRKEKQDTVYTGLTGVKREYRGIGLAKAMKVKGIEVASEKGISKVTTENESENEAMLHINQKLGFEKKPAWISYEKVL